MMKRYNKKRTKIVPKPFATEERGKIGIAFFGDKKNPAISFSRLVRDEDGKLIRFDKTFKHAELMALRDAVDRAMGLHNPNDKERHKPSLKPQNDHTLPPPVTALWMERVNRKF